MKTKTILLTALLASMSLPGFSQTIQATVNGTPVQFDDAQPMMMASRIMVPLRGVFEHMGATVVWDRDTGAIRTSAPGTDVVLRIGEAVAMIDGDPVAIGTPATIVNGRAMVPLRFVSEALGAQVMWVPRTRTVQISTAGYGETFYSRIEREPGRTSLIESRTVIPFKLERTLGSNLSRRGDEFTAVLDTHGESDYAGLPIGTRLEGHVDLAQAKAGNTPGVLGLAFDRVRLPDGRSYPIEASLSPLDDKSVEMRDGRLVAKDASQNNLKYVGIGAGAGAIVAVLTKGNVVTNSLLGAALGYLYGEIQKGQQKSSDVTLKPDTAIGVRLDGDLWFKPAKR